MFLHLDCRHYLGDRPCKFQRLCQGCNHYAPMGPRVLIIKLGALGDVVRTAVLLPGLAELNEPPHVTWLTSAAARPLVERMPGVDRVLTFEPLTLAQLDLEQFDSVLSLDKEPQPCAVAMRVKAGQRLGIGLSRHGTVFPLNEECDPYFRLGLDNEEKFYRNQKTYPELIYEALGLPYRGQRYQLVPTPADNAQAQACCTALGLDPGALRIGINPGAGHVFAHKAWREDGYLELIARLAETHPRAEILLVGGADERELLARLKAEAPAGARVHDTGGLLPLGAFLALLGTLDVLVCGDTLAMHLAVAQQRRVVAIFGPTCPQEIDLFGLGEKIVSPIECAPCYRRACDKTPHCQDMISTQQVLETVEQQLTQARAENASTQPCRPLPPAVR